MSILCQKICKPFTFRKKNCSKISNRTMVKPLFEVYRFLLLVRCNFSIFLISQKIFFKNFFSGFVKQSNRETTYLEGNKKIAVLRQGLGERKVAGKQYT